MVAIWHGPQHRPPPRTQLDGFFSRKGDSLPVTAIAADYGPGDLVTWDLGNNVPHIGIVVDQKSPETGRYLVVHNIGRSRSPDGRCPIALESHGPLPLLRSAELAPRVRLRLAEFQRF